jgi:uroporphyrinogen-III decarboxylase
VTNRERLLAILSGERPDNIPWIPRLLLWYNAHKKAGTLPERYRGWSLRDIERDLGLGTPARTGRVFRSELRDVEIRERQVGEMDRLVEYITPVGTVSEHFRSSQLLRDTAIQDAQVEFMLKQREDYAVVEYIVEHTRYAPTYEAYGEYEREIGDDGYPLVSCGDCPFHHWMLKLVGYNNAYYHLEDHAREVEQLVDLMEQRDKEMVWPLIADSPAGLILHGTHFSSDFTPPPVFEQYILPYYQELSALLHSRGKTLALHADNDTRMILSHIEQAGYGMAECFATYPMVKTTLEEARATWEDRVIIWGGVPSVILEDTYSEEQFEAHMRDLFRTIGSGEAFILGVADNVMPGAKIERLRRITHMVEEFG